MSDIFSKLKLNGLDYAWRAGRTALMIVLGGTLVYALVKVFGGGAAHFHLCFVALRICPGAEQTWSATFQTWVVTKHICFVLFQICFASYQICSVAL